MEWRRPFNDQARSESRRKCGIPGGTVVGATNDLGTEITERTVTPANLHLTYYKALDIDPRKTYQVGSRPVYLADETAEAIQDLN